VSEFGKHPNLQKWGYLGVELRTSDDGQTEHQAAEVVDMGEHAPWGRGPGSWGHPPCSLGL
jgi:hypothetical protein